MTAGPFLALAAALGFAVARVVLKRALSHTTLLTGVVVSISFTGSVLLRDALRDDWRRQHSAWRGVMSAQRQISANDLYKLKLCPAGHGKGSLVR
jgi:hypothetical protein